MAILGIARSSFLQKSGAHSSTGQYFSGESKLSLGSWVRIALGTFATIDGTTMVIKGAAVQCTLYSITECSTAAVLTSADTIILIG